MMRLNIKKILIWTAAVAVAAGAVLYWAYKTWLDVDYQGPEVRLYIPRDAGPDDVRDSLTMVLGGFGDAVYKIWSARKGSPGVAFGSYVISPGEKALAVSRRLLTGRQTPMRFTFNNMRTFDELVGKLGSKFAADSAAFAACADTFFVSRGFAPEQMAAAVIPDTYEFYWTADPGRVFRTLNNARTAYWDSTRTARAGALGLTPADVATIASIVEEETAKADERPTVARLYINRLQRNMPLQADPTVKFAIGDFSLRRITTEHLAVESPYNTYLNPGLPPGPIRIPERSTLEAVLNAPEHDYLYMCAKSDFSGYHDFATTYDRHRINAARYHRALSARGIH